LCAEEAILALGQQTDTAFLREVPGVEIGRDGTVQVSASIMTGCPGVFAGGDMVPAERTVTVGTGHGKKAARHIDAWLRATPAGGAGPGSTGHRARSAATAKHDVVSSSMLNLWYLGDAARRQQPQSPAEQRTAGFGEVVGGLSEAPTAAAMATRSGAGRGSGGGAGGGSRRRPR
jgi:hypothetical protein